MRLGGVVVDAFEDLDGFGVDLVARVEGAAEEGIWEDCYSLAVCRSRSLDSVRRHEPVLRTKCGLRRWYQRQTAASVCILLLAATACALPFSNGSGAHAPSKSSIFQLSLVTSFLSPR